MLKVTVIVGLPGAGKTTYIEANFRDAKIFDDFHKGAKDDSPLFEKSKNYLPLIKALIEGNDCVISDVEFCRQNNLEIVIKNLEEIATAFDLNIKTELLAFENNPEKCKINAVARGRAHHPAELKKIDDLAKIYYISPGAKILPVITKKQ